ncbi:PREDICTED: non-specific phospholipase C4-like [Tarenaya hassleriana]|uniref:non-specific phospholipase C4-like n=1 Tax=Tarenaya hassleriana TaxID=28532 RepID=UPI00053C638B|nr:PREDICTED: non-specific phospholipase C4-like [Tarenaya hassleriana]
MTAETSGPVSSSRPCPIKTVVVLVQENRSFDHMLGWFKDLNPDIDGVERSNPKTNPKSGSDPNSPVIEFGDRSQYVDPDPGHSIQDIYEQVFGKPWDPNHPDPNPGPPTMSGFAQNAERNKTGMSSAVMNGFKPDALPVYKELVTNFAICDRWFAAVPASTQPNRLFVHSATSHGATSNDKKLLAEGFPQKTIFESLDEAGFSFGIYYQFPPSTLFYRNLRNPKYLTHFHEYGIHFKNDCEKGKLPNYVVIEQRWFDLLSIPGNDDHPSHDVSEGQKLVKEVYEALRSSPQWNEILFVVTYDEHGGFYDHVPTPVHGVPSPDGIPGPEPYRFEFNRLGVRVPTFFISPWVERGTMVHGPNGPYPTSQYEHSSIPATVKKIFNLKDFLTKRDEWAATFDSVLTRPTPRLDCPEKLPTPVKLRATVAKEDAELSEFQQELVIMAAGLNGDYKDEDLMHKLCCETCVLDAAKYVETAFEEFLKDSRQARGGRDENDVVSVPDQEAATQPQDAAAAAATRTQTSFLRKLFSCIVCDH